MKSHEWKQRSAHHLPECKHCGCVSATPWYHTLDPCRGRYSRAEWSALIRARVDQLRADFGLPPQTDEQWAREPENPEGGDK